jgi:hypothetical protein
VAGGGNPSSGIGDNGPATAATLSYPWGIAVDSAGNLFIADAGNALIRKVAAGTGIITTVAGGGADPEQLGDFGPATSAFMIPYGVTVDAAGNLYIADKTNHRIRKMNAKSGTVATVAGSDNFGFLGDNAPATDATFAYPTGVVLDRAGNLFVADRYNNRIRAVRGPISDPVPSPPKVNLAPYAPAGWSAPVVPSDVTGTHTTGKLIGGQPTYIDWAVVNNGQADITVPITYELRIDGVSQKRWSSDDGLAQNTYTPVEDYAVTLTAGQHTITIVADPDNTIAESNENDNSFTFTGTWITFVSQVNLTPYTPTGWSNPVVPSHVTGTNTTGNLIAGQPTYIDWAVTNSGALDITVPVTYELRIDGVAQNRWYAYDGLKQGFYNFIEDYAVTLTAGQHTITIVADPDNDIVETSESDNSFTFTGTWTTTPPPARVNLTPYAPSGWSNPVVPSDVTGTHTTGNLIAGQPTYIDWAVINNGDADITGPVVYELRIDGTAQKRWQSDGLKQGFYTSTEDYAATLSAGSHTITIVADPDNAIVETNENDNSFTFTGTWTAPPRVNLTPYTPSGWSNPVVPSDVTGTHTTGKLIAGQPTYIDWAVTNNGDADITGPVIYELRIDGVAQKRWQSDGLKQGFYSFNEDYGVTLSAGSHTITIVADPDNAIAETNENDNSFTFTGNWTATGNGVNLVPYTPAGWSNPVVPSDVIGTHTTSNLIAGKPTYIDWAAANDGNVDITAPVIYELRVDGVAQKRWQGADGLKQGFYVSIEDFAVTLTAGVHTITIVADPDNTIAETNESDNSFTFTGTWVLGVGKVAPVN